MYKRILLAALVAAMTLAPRAARAVVTNQNSPVSYACAGTAGAKTFTITFPYLSYTHFSVKTTTGSGVVTTLVPSTDYTISPTSSNTVGTLTLVPDGTKCPAGSTLTITRVVPNTQSLSLSTQGPYSPKAIEGALDSLEMQIQGSNNTVTANRADLDLLLGGGYTPQPLVWTLTPNGSTAAFTINGAAVTLPELYQVTIDGVVQKPTTDYTINTSTQTITFASAPAVNASVVVRTLGYAKAVTVDETTQPGGGSLTPFVNPRGSPHFCTGLSSVDSTSCLQAAVNAAAGGTLVIPAGTYKVTSTITVTSPTRIVGQGGTIFMAFTSSSPAGGMLFNVTSSNVEFSGVVIDSTGTPAATTGNKYALRFGGVVGTHLTGIRVRNCRITNLPWADIPGVLSTHAIYMVYVDGPIVENNLIDNPSGAAVFFSAVTDGKILNNSINNTGWYSIQFNDLVDGVLAFGNRITGTAAGSRNWGGSFNLMSNSSTGTNCGTVGCARIKHINMIGNYISGVHSYTGAVHIESSSFVNFSHNIMRDISLTDTTPPVYVRVYVRPGAGTTNEGPNDNINISDNILVANGLNNLGIYIDAQSNGGTLAYSDSISIRNNKIFSPDASNTFNHAIMVHGQQGGWRNVSITGNQTIASPTDSSPTGGLIGTLGLVTAPVSEVLITGNNVSYLGTPANSTHTGIVLGDYVQRSLVDANTVKNCWNGIRTLTNASSSYVGPNNIFSGSASSDYSFTSGISVGYGTIPKYGSTLAIASRSSDLVATTVASLVTVGEYRVCATARTITSGTGTTATMNIIWTDEGGVKTDAVGTWALNSVTVTGQINKCEYIHAAASTNIQVSITGGTYGTSAYALTATAEKLN